MVSILSKILAVAILLPSLLFGAESLSRQSIGDTLWIARSIPPARTAHMVFKRPFSVVYSKDGTRFTLSCAAIVKDSTGKLVTLDNRARWIGVSSSLNRIVFTTSDTLSTKWEPGFTVLDAGGKFTDKRTLRNNLTR